MSTTIRYHEGDISGFDMKRYTDAVAIDTETLGLVPRRDRLCVVQLSPGDGTADVIRIARGQSQAPNLCSLLADASRQKIFHYGRFDIAVLFHTFGVTTQNVFCTKIASRLGDRVGLTMLDTAPGSLLYRAARLRALASTSDLVVSHCHPFDVVPALAFADRRGLPPVVYIDNTDHVFWVGVRAYDRVVHLRRSGQDLALHRRGPHMSGTDVSYFKLPQKRWMRVQASSRSDVLVA